jgi:hypothetical protein
MINSPRSIGMPSSSKNALKNESIFRDNSVGNLTPRNLNKAQTQKTTLPPLASIALYQKNQAEENHLMSYINQQNQMLQMLSSRIGQQQREYVEKQKRDLSEKLKVLEMENALKMQEYELLELEAQHMHRRPTEKQKKKKKKQSNFSGLLEKVMFKKAFKDLPGDIFGGFLGKADKNNEQEEESVIIRRRNPNYNLQIQPDMYGDPSEGMYDPYYGNGYDPRGSFYPPPGQNKNNRQKPPAEKRSNYARSEAEEQPKEKKEKKGNQKKSKSAKSRKNIEEEEEEVEEEIIEEEDIKPKNTRQLRR